jgi:tRNA-specific 2-thiouridylase
MTNIFQPKSLIENRVVIAMSGGVDSSVAAALLVEQGYDVVGMMMRLWSEPGLSPRVSVNRCCTPDQMADARRVADLLHIPFYVVDVQDYFRNSIVQFFIEEHEQGRTPNPCIECNRQIRFTYLFNQAMALDANYLATGHYARVVATADGAYQLHKAVDRHKDQSYVLHVLTQEHLAHVKFPVGDYTKDEVRELARKFKLPVAAKSESQDLCFLGDGDYRRFLTEYSERVAVPGPIVDGDGRQLGQHNGLSFYTIGQRKGLGISTPEPVFVLKKDVARNALVVGSREALGQCELQARDVNWLSGQTPGEPITAQVKIRYKANEAAATLIDGENGRVHIQFHGPVYGITPGQGAVFYDGDVCLGGGIIV